MSKASCWCVAATMSPWSDCAATTCASTPHPPCGVGISTFAVVLTTVLVLPLLLQPVAGYTRCLTEHPEVVPKRHLFYEGLSEAITIETSDRPSHQLVSHILHILIEEVLGYSKVIIKKGYNKMKTKDILNRLAGCPPPPTRCGGSGTGSTNRHGVPETMINVEVWNRAGFNMADWVHGEYVMDHGPLGPVGKFGWFMPTQTVEGMWSESKLIIDHWRALKVSDITKRFVPDDADLMRLVDTATDVSDNVIDEEPVAEDDVYEEESLEQPMNAFALGMEIHRGSSGSQGDLRRDGGGCEGGECDPSSPAIYRPPQCSGFHNKGKCALLLAGHQEVAGGLLRQQVSQLGLSVDVLWVGERLDSLVTRRTSLDDGGHQRPMLFFNWVPNHITAAGNFTRVNFPLCRTALVGDPVNCDFEVHQLSKISWLRLERHAPYVHHLLQKLNFTQTQYEDLLRMLEEDYTDNGDTDYGDDTGSDARYRATACAWLHKKPAQWKAWIPKNLSNKTNIYLGGMIPLTGKYVRQKGVVPAARIALELVERDPNVLADYKLELLIQDTQCQPDIVLTQFLQYLVNTTHPIAGILGPSCSETAEPVAGVAKHFNHILVSYSAEAVHLSKRAMFPYFFRTVPHISQNGEVYVALFERLGWRRVALLAEDGQEFPEYHAFLQDLFSQHAINIVFHRKMPRATSTEDASKVPFSYAESEPAYISEYLEDIKSKGAKIIILTSFEVSGRAVFCEAYKQRMTAAAGYVWFLPGWYTPRWWDTDLINAKNNGDERITCSSQQMLQAIQGHFVLSSALFGDAASVIAGGITVGTWKMIYDKFVKYNSLEPSVYASYAYDAVWVFALALDKLLKEDPSRIESMHTDATTQRFMYFLNNTHFHGVSGPVQFKGQDRTGIIDITIQKENKTELVGQFLPDRSNLSERFTLDEAKISALFGGQIPADGTQDKDYCGAIEGLRVLLGVACDTAIVIANVVAVSVFIIVVLVVLVGFKKRYDDKVRKTQARMEELGLLADTSWLSLDQWEISREHVVLNRKLGEGAFGTVYGGEALVEDTWVAVAVKTLKVGSDPEQKLDFLSEAEMMKRFEHDNIVRLLGVCTRGEPAYAVMEFMLHGDLKTFLLARRQLVGEDTREAEDVQPDKLTRMALDIAHGLHYLTQLRYVHRDLACRNCLVHATKRVKIGDFGMTRPMYDSDYYRFSRRGMLPVRWMAPESLSDGIFTASSDIWSFAVLVYEIITFGSFPYQGLSNKQVLEHVKSGNTIRLPNTCPEQLQHLLTRCWSYDAAQRPVVEDVIAALEASGGENEPLIRPCLEPLRAAGGGGDPGGDADAVEHEVSLPAAPRVRGVQRGTGAGAPRTSMSEHSLLGGGRSPTSADPNSPLVSPVTASDCPDTIVTLPPPPRNRSSSDKLNCIVKDIAGGSSGIMPRDASSASLSSSSSSRATGGGSGRETHRQNHRTGGIAAVIRSPLSITVGDGNPGGDNGLTPTPTPPPPASDAGSGHPLANAHHCAHNDHNDEAATVATLVSDPQFTEFMAHDGHHCMPRSLANNKVLTVAVANCNSHAPLSGGPPLGASGYVRAPRCHHHSDSAGAIPLKHLGRGGVGNNRTDADGRSSQVMTPQDGKKTAPPFDLWTNSVAPNVV